MFREPHRKFDLDCRSLCIPGHNDRRQQHVLTLVSKREIDRGK